MYKLNASFTTLLYSIFLLFTTLVQATALPNRENKIPFDERDVIVGKIEDNLFGTVEVRQKKIRCNGEQKVLIYSILPIIPSTQTRLEGVCENEDLSIDIQSCKLANTTSLCHCYNKVVDYYELPYSHCVQGPSPEVNLDFFKQNDSGTW